MSDSYRSHDLSSMVGLSRIWLSLGLVVSLSAALLVGSPSPAGAVAGYGDVGEGTWYTDAVQWSTDNGIADIAGFCFGPDTAVSRGETAVWIYNMENQPDAGDPHSFSDVSDASQDNAISWMANNGITTGKSPTRFAPDDTLTRAEAATFLHRLAGKPSAPPHSFVDVVAGWQQGGVSWMAHAGITTGTSPTTFAPEDTLTRAHLVTFLYRYKDEPEVTINTSTPNCDPTAEAAEDPADFSMGDFKTVSAGRHHSCGVRSDDTVSCGGANGDGQADAPTGDFKTVSAGDFHSCGVRSDDTVSCWGANGDGRADAPTGDFKTVSAGGYHSCGVRSDDTVSCWGRNGDGRADAPTGDFKTVSAGGYHSCGVRSDDTVSCWGDNGDGRADAPTGDFKTVSAGWAHSCGVRSDDTVSCWGANGDGRADAPTGDFKTVSAGRSHSCGVRSDDTVSCWGGNSDGRADAPTGDFKTVSAGAVHSCGVRGDDTVSCWGGNWEGQADAPTGDFKTVSAGWAHSCGVRSDDTVSCWGYNGQGRADAPTGDFKTVSAGFHSCGVRSDDTVSCWGANWGGQADAPTGDFKTVSAGGYHSCGVRGDDTVSCWGHNWYGQADAPTGDFKTVSAGWAHSCGVRSDDTVSCWGYNGQGRADDPTGDFKTVSAGFHSCGVRSDDTVSCWYGQADAPTGDFKTVSAGGSHSCGVRGDDTVSCWGANWYGQADAPTGDFKTVSAGGYHSCGVRSDDTVTCWRSWTFKHTVVQYDTGDTIAGFPAGFAAFSGNFSGASVKTTGSAVTVEINDGGSASYTTVTYTCASVGGCTIVNGRVTKGTVNASQVSVSDAHTPDLVVDTATVDTSALSVGESFTLSAVVGNQGDGRSSSTTLRYYRSTDATITTGDTEVGTDSVFGLDAQETGDESVSVTAPSVPGTYYYGACVDSVSDEPDTTNNCSTAVTVTVEDALAAPVVEPVAGTSTELEVQFEDFIGVGETRAYDFAVRAIPGGSWVEACNTFSNTSGQAATATITQGFTGLEPGTAYAVRYRYRNSSRCGAGSPGEWSPIAQGTTNDDEAPAAPMVEPRAGTSTELEVQFEDFIGVGETRAYDFAVRAISGGSWVEACNTFSNTSGQAATATITQGFTGLEPGTAYAVRYRYRNSSRCGAGSPGEWSPIAQGTTNDDEVPAAPMVEPRAGTSTELEVQFEDFVGVGETRAYDFAVRAISGGSWVEACNTFSNTSGQAATATITQGFTGLEPGTAYAVRYRYRNSSRCGAGSPGEWSPIAQGTTNDDEVPAAPMVEPRAGTSTELEVQFEDFVGVGETRAYDFAVRAISGGSWVEACNTFSNTSGQAATATITQGFTGLEPGTAYAVRYRYRNSSRCGAGSPGEWSPIGQGTTNDDEAAPDLVVDTPTVETNAPVAGERFTLSATVRNQGDERSAFTTLRYYQSTDATITTGDAVVGTDFVSALDAQESGAESIIVTAPSTPGTYYYGACVDSVSDESDTTNNCSTAVTVIVGGAPTPDLVVDTPTVDTNSPVAGESFTLSATVRNQGDGRSLLTTLRYYQSTDATITTADAAVGTDFVSALDAQESGDESVSVTAPSTPGTYYYGACVDSVSDESDTTNNCSTAVTVIVGGAPTPDLVVDTPTVDTNSPVAGESFMLSTAVRNQGDGRSLLTTLRYYQSTDATITTADAAVGTDLVSGLDALESGDESVSVTAPSTPGTYYYGACVDSVSDESDTTNNCSTAVTVIVGGAPTPDLVVDTPTVDTNSPVAGESFMLSTAVRNQGDGRSLLTTLRYYQSTDATITTADAAVGTDLVSGLDALESGDESVSVTAPSTPGTYYYGACVDSVSDESDTTNNCSTAVTVIVGGAPTPDLVVDTPTVDTNSPVAGESFMLSTAVRNQGDGRSLLTTLRYYQSTDATITTADAAVGTDLVSGLDALESGDESVSVTAPSTPGTYYYGACVDSVSDESDTTNNCSTAVTVTVVAAPTLELLGDCQDGMKLQVGQGCNYQGVGASEQQITVLLSVQNDGAICREGGPVTVEDPIFGIPVPLDNVEKCDPGGFERDDTFGSDITVEKNTDGSWTFHES